jgi:dihydroorotase-like cyclic amidohydrolase
MGGKTVSRIELPGLVDPHVHLREPGATHKEDYLTGTSAALAGGYVAVADMPNNTQPIVDVAALEQKRAAAGKAVCDYGFWWGATQGNATLSPEASHWAVGLKVYMSHTFGPLLVDDLGALIAHFRDWPRGKPIAVHAEGATVAQAILLGHLFGQHVHVCHLAGRAQATLVRRAKEKGMRVTCEVTPHHLFLTETDTARLGSLAHMRPPVGSADDQRALWENLDIFDMVATDHAPHTLQEKRSPQPPPGVPGLETALALMLNAVREGRLSMERLVELMSTGPRRLLGLADDPTSRTIVDTDARWEIRGDRLQTRCRWTPFEGMAVAGRVVETRLRGTVAWRDGRVVVAPGFGRPLGGRSIE